MTTGTHEYMRLIQEAQQRERARQAEEALKARYFLDRGIAPADYTEQVVTEAMTGTGQKIKEESSKIASEQGQAIQKYHRENKVIGDLF